MLKRNFRYLLDVIYRAGVASGELMEEPDYKLSFNPLWSMSETESTDKTGTAEQPILFTSGMAVYPNYYYTDGTTRYVCLQAGTPEEIAEGAWFTEF